MPAKLSRRNLVHLVLSLLMIAGAAWVILNRQYVYDQLSVWQYKPPAEIQAINQRVGFSPQGTFLFYASKPALQDRADFNVSCQRLAEKTAVLGCYTKNTVYIFRITDQRLDGIEEVTAAHEMLHAAYQRLSSSERGEVNKMIEANTTKVLNEKLKKRLALYEKTEPGERLNELHSMLGSEMPNLSPDLERYYARYFVDRAKVAALAQKYESVFDEIANQQSALVNRLNELARTITADTVAYQTAVAQLEKDIEAFNKKADQGGFSSRAIFDSQRAALLARQTQINADREKIMAEINSHNEGKKQLDALNSNAASLQQSIDSNALIEAPKL